MQPLRGLVCLCFHSLALWPSSHGVRKPHSPLEWILTGSQPRHPAELPAKCSHCNNSQTHGIWSGGTTGQHAASPESTNGWFKSHTNNHTRISTMRCAHGQNRHKNNVHGPVSLGELSVKKKGRRGYVSLLSTMESQECNFIEKNIKKHHLSSLSSSLQVKSKTMSKLLRANCLILPNSSSQ